MQYFSEYEPIMYGVLQGSILGPLFFILYINDLTKTMATSANPVLFADDTSINITNPDLMEFTNSINEKSIKLNRWFKSNSFSLNIDKTHFLRFFTKTNQNCDFQPYYDNRQITKFETIKFLGITLDSKLSWKQRIEDITPTFNKVCFAIRSIKPFMSIEAMRLIYFAYFHSIFSDGIIFWGNYVQSKYIFKIKKELLQ